jgi:PKD repeat protein
MRNLFVPSLLALTLAACLADGEPDTNQEASALEGEPEALLVNATYDPVLKAPRCATSSSICDTGDLVNGRGVVGPEPNAPNTINNSCSDGGLGQYHFDESIDRIRVFTLEGTPMAPGATVQIEVTAFVYSGFTSDHLDLFYAADANNPVWTYLTTIAPPGSGTRVLSTTYTLPQGSLQAVRANFRYLGSPSACSPGGYDDRDDLIFSVEAAPTASFTSSCDIFFDCAFADTSTDPDGNIASWSWSFGDGETSTEQSPAHTYAAPGTYTVSLTVTDGSGLSSTASQEITLIDPGVPPIASMSYDCVDISCSYSDASTDADGNIVSWSWDFGDGTSSTAQNPGTHHYQVAGTYIVTLTVTDAVGFSAIAEEWVTVVAPNIGLGANGFMISGKRFVNLTWSGATAATVDVYQDGVLVGTTANDGAHRVQVNGTSTADYNFWICHAGTFACSNVATATI